MNFANRTIWTADNIEILPGIDSECVDLVYLDPPFNSNRDYAAPIGSKAAGAAFKDTWTLSDLDVAAMGRLADTYPSVYAVIDAAGQVHGKGMMSYLVMMADRLVECHRILKPTGSLYLHCDPTAGHYIKFLMDSIFGANQFRSQVIWRRANAKGLAFRGYPNNADYLLYYTKGDNFTWNRPYRPHNPEYVKKFYRHIEPRTGRRYQLDNLVNPNKDRPNLTYEFLGVTRVWRWTKERMQAAFEKGIVVQTKPGAVPRLKRYLDEMKGNPVDTIWEDVKPLQAASKERTGYPNPKTPRPFGAHNRGQQQRGRFGPRPLLRLRHHLYSRRKAGPPLGRNRHLPQRRQPSSLPYGPNRPRHRWSHPLRSHPRAITVRRHQNAQTPNQAHPLRPAGR